MIEKATRLRADLALALGRLEAALARPVDEFIRDSAIQRFEFTFELFWKTLKALCEEEGLRVHSPREAMRGAFQIGLLPEDDAFFRMLEDRNLTSHTYDVATAEDIFSRLAGHAKAIRETIDRMAQRAP